MVCCKANNNSLLICTEGTRTTNKFSVSKKYIETKVRKYMNMDVELIQTFQQRNIM